MGTEDGPGSSYLFICVYMRPDDESDQDPSFITRTPDHHALVQFRHYACQRGSDRTGAALACCTRYSYCFISTQQQILERTEQISGTYGSGIQQLVATMGRQQAESSLDHTGAASRARRHRKAGTKCSVVCRSQGDQADLWIKQGHHQGGYMLWLSLYVC